MVGSDKFWDLNTMYREPCLQDYMECDAPLSTSRAYQNNLPQPRVGTSTFFGNPSPGMPTPPRSPPLEYELDELVASIPEILDTSPATDKNFREILYDLESTFIETVERGNNLYSAWNTFVPQTPTAVAVPSPSPENLLKKDIMWSVGACSSSPTAGLLSPPLERKQTNVPEANDSRLPDPIRMYVSDEEVEHFPETPAGSDTDGDEVDPDHLTLDTATVSSEHNYCGRLPHSAPANGDFKPLSPILANVRCSDKQMPSLAQSAQRTKVPDRRVSMLSSTLAPSGPSPTIISPEVKRQLQITIHESMRNKQRSPSTTPAPSPRGRSSPSNNSLPSPSAAPPSVPSIVCTSLPPPPRLCPPTPVGGVAASPACAPRPTQGKPAAYTKRMREYHSEVLRSNKRKRVSSGEVDEGRRFVHNSLERQRRVDLRNAFEHLRQLVPDTAAMEKAPKVQILKKAAQYCLEMQQQEMRLIKEYERLNTEFERGKRLKAQLESS